MDWISGLMWKIIEFATMSEQCEKDSKAHVEEIKEVSEVSNT